MAWEAGDQMHIVVSLCMQGVLFVPRGKNQSWRGVESDELAGFMEGWTYCSRSLPLVSMQGTYTGHSWDWASFLVPS